MMKCKDCPYFYDKEMQDYISLNAADVPIELLEDEYGKPRPRCQYHYEDGLSPCEIDDIYIDEE